MWDRDFIDQVRQANNIVDVIGSYVPLKRSGANYKALSPFKKEKTPSFIVNDIKQIWYCFSSNQGGDVFKFIQLYENIDFPAAVRMLAKRANLTLPTFHSDRATSPTEISLKEQLYDLHERVAHWWHHNLLKEKSAQPARDYLKQRAITSETAKEFLLGYAPAGWENTYNWAKKEGFPIKLLETSGLFLQKENEAFYDRFRHRLMFPIIAESGQIVGFSGRVLETEAKEAKYINSPETLIFTKGKVLFGLYHHKRSLLDKRQALVCEGQLDLITCHQAGIRNLVASQGTAFTEAQARLLKRYTDEVVLCFDSDSAGRLAIIRSLPTLLEVQLPVRILQIPDKSDRSKNDPDSFVRDHGVQAFEKLIQDAPDFWNYFLQNLVQTHSPQTERGRSVIKKEVYSLLTYVKEPTQQDHILMRLASRLNTTLPLLRQELKHQNNPRKIVTPNAETAKHYKPHASIDHLLKLCFQDPNLIPEIQRKLKPEWVAFCDGFELLNRLMEAHADATWVDLHSFIQTLSEPENNYCISLMASHHSLIPNLTLALDSCLAKIQRSWLEQEIKKGNSPLKELNSFRTNSNHPCSTP
ncbi:MAG: DNA primase [Verrucomicrobiia bacterium]